jgi:hypothetical protein
MNARQYDGLFHEVVKVAVNAYMAGVEAKEKEDPLVFELMVHFCAAKCKSEAHDNAEDTDHDKTKRLVDSCVNYAFTMSINGRVGYCIKKKGHCLPTNDPEKEMTLERIGISMLLMMLGAKWGGKKKPKILLWNMSGNDQEPLFAHLFSPKLPRSNLFGDVVTVLDMVSSTVELWCSIESNSST